MSNTNPVNWFEIPVSDIARAKAFYQRVFDLELMESQMGPLEMAWFPMEDGAAGATGSLVKGDGYRPSHDGSLVYLGVSSMEATLERIEEHGGRTLTPKTSIGEHGFFAHFEDCEGNRVALHSQS